MACGQSAKANVVYYKAVAVVILLSDVMQVGDAQYKTIGISPMDDTASKKQMMEVFIKKVKYLADKSRPR
jgi:hypothetical protein